MKKGFTLAEIMFVAGIVTSLSVGVYQAVARGKRAQCMNNLKQIYQALTMFEMEHGRLPDAKFFPSSADDPKGIHNILKPYGVRGDIFFCPSLPPQLNNYGTNYIWNDEVNNKTLDSLPPDTWLMTEMTAVTKKIPPPHGPFFCILYADGRVEAGPRINFPDVETKREFEETTKEKPTLTISERKFNPSIIAIPEKKKIVAGEKIEVEFSIIDSSGERVNLNGKKIAVSSDCKDDILPENVEITQNTKTGQFEVIFAKAGKRKLILEDKSQNLKSEISFEVSPGKTEKFIFSNIPFAIQAGKKIEIGIFSADKYGNKTEYNGEITLFDLTGNLNTNLKISDGKGKIDIVFKKAINSNFIIAGNEDIVGKSPQFKILPSEKIVLKIIKPEVIIAGQNCPVKLEISDEYENPVENFSGEIKLIAKNNEIDFPNKINFLPQDKGKKEITLTFYKTGENQIIFVSEKFQTKETFSVDPGPLHYYEIEDISDQTAGKPFTVFVKGKDKWGNRITSFYIKDLTGTLRKVEKDFSAGMWIEKVVITEAGENQILIDDGYGHTGKSNKFYVKPADANKIEIENLPVIAEENAEYKIVIFIKDRYENQIKQHLTDYEILFPKNCEFKFENDEFPLRVSVKFKKKGLYKITVNNKKESKKLGEFLVSVFPKGSTK